MIKNKKRLNIGIDKDLYELIKDTNISKLINTLLKEYINKDTQDTHINKNYPVVQDTHIIKDTHNKIEEIFIK